MKRFLILVLCLLMLSGCAKESTPTETTVPETTETIETETAQEPLPTEEAKPEMPEPKPVPKDSDFVRVADYIPDILVELKYATADNFTGKEIYSFSEVYLRYGTVAKLAVVQEQLANKGLRLKIWDGFRPVSSQFRLWEACPDPNFVSHPETGNRTHCRGNTVDITLADVAGHELEMPTGFDDFSSLADRNYADCGEDEAANALLLQEIMEQNGFSGYFGEWWHFSDTTEYPVEEVFDPALTSQWYADCMEYLSLREAPDPGASTIARIPVGEEMTLMGFVGDFALVDYEGLQGYVLSSYLSPVEYYAEVEEGNPISLNKPMYRAVCENYISLRTEADFSAEVITHIPAGGTFILLEWCELFALVDYNGTFGYVAVDYIEPV